MANLAITNITHSNGKNSSNDELTSPTGKKQQEEEAVVGGDNLRDIKESYSDDEIARKVRESFTRTCASGVKGEQLRRLDHHMVRCSYLKENQTSDKEN